MPLRFISSDSDSEEKAAAATTTRLFGSHRPLHELFGGRKVADVVLWRKKRLSAAIMAGFSVLWFLLEVVEYHFLTLLCHISITGMLLLFIWSSSAALFDKYLASRKYVRFFMIRPGNTGEHFSCVILRYS
ncbi:reticulon-like protein B9, partial [Phalaenopsis equestris]|uniref:reticulon-like protein B9 n=1 Tax=Phalaenopsis equestris TaxID=78828 RepID=UPI0009E2BED7